MTYEEQLALIGPEAATDVLCHLLRPQTGSHRFTSAEAKRLGFYDEQAHLTMIGEAFAVEHMAAELERIAGLSVTTQVKRYETRCRVCGWTGQRTQIGTGFGSCGKCGGVLERRVRAKTYKRAAGE